MEHEQYFRGSLREVNLQLTNLEKRKKQLLQEESGEPAFGVHTLTEGSYAAYLGMMQKRREPVQNPRVVFQGEAGAYSEMACRRFFGKNVNAKGLYQFEDTFLALKNGEADYAVLPIENSTSGAIRQVYDLLESNNYFFVGETTVLVNHALMALPGTKIEDIRTVYSHEQGLFQCERYLKNHPDWKKVPQADTAGSAKAVAALQDKTIAAICSPLAAEIYGLEILEESLATNTTNTTRFVVVSPLPELRPNRDKICISLTTANDSGALHNVLTVFALHGINLVRLESRPIPEHNWEYMFFIEFTGDLMTVEMDAAIHEISLLSSDLRVLGNFTSNLSPA